jgi:uncharacterized protein (TIGR00251 family)
VSERVVVRAGRTGARLCVRVVPRGARNAIEGVRNGELAVRVTSPPVDGAANAAVIALVADAFGLAKRDISVVAGQTSRHKTLELGGLDEAACRARLSAILR